MIAGLSLTDASNILGQDMNPVDAPQCCPSRGWQCVAPDVDLGECTFHSPLWNPEETSLKIQIRGTSGSKIGYVNVSDKNNLKIINSLKFICKMITKLGINCRKLHEKKRIIQNQTWARNSKEIIYQFILQNSLSLFLGKCNVLLISLSQGI